MNIGRFEYDSDRERWTVVDGDGEELLELHCGDTIVVRDMDDGDWFRVRIELDNHMLWYIIMEDGQERDDFELLDVQL